MLHEAGDHSAMNGWQDRVADGVLVGGQAKDHIVAQAQTLDADQLRVRNQAQQRVVVILLVGLAHQRIQIQLAHELTPGAGALNAWLASAPLPMRIKVPTTWAMGCCGSSWYA